MPERAPASGRPADVAVVIVNYNSGEDVTHAARSAMDAAGDARVEVVVVDNTPATAAPTAPRPRSRASA